MLQLKILTLNDIWRFKKKLALMIAMHTVGGCVLHCWLYYLPFMGFGRHFVKFDSVHIYGNTELFLEGKRNKLSK